MAYDYNDERPAGKVWMNSNRIYLLPATFDKPTLDMTESLFHDYGVHPVLLFPAKGDKIPEPLEGDLPKDNPEAFVYEFNPKPLQIESGPMGELDPQKVKNNFLKLHNKWVSMREFSFAIITGRTLVKKDVRR